MEQADPAMLAYFNFKQTLIRNVKVGHWLDIGNELVKTTSLGAGTEETFRFSSFIFGTAIVDVKKYAPQILRWLETHPITGEETFLHSGRTDVLWDLLTRAGAVDSTLTKLCAAHVSKPPGPRTIAYRALLERLDQHWTPPEVRRIARLLGMPRSAVASVTTTSLFGWLEKTKVLTETSVDPLLETAKEAQVLDESITTLFEAYKKKYLC